MSRAEEVGAVGWGGEKEEGRGSPPVPGPRGILKSSGLLFNARATGSVLNFIYTLNGINFIYY